MTKRFKDKAAAAFISAETKEDVQVVNSQKEETVENLAENQHLVIHPKENKSKSVQLLMKPSLHAKVKKSAATHGVSFNEFVGILLEKYTL